MTAPDWKRNGLAHACLNNSMQDMLAAGDDQLSLVVTVANVAARTVHEGLVFHTGR
jgi:predicted GNAT family acetyltransferase